MQDEDILTNKIGSIMLESDCFAKVNARGWEANHDAFIADMVNRFGRDYRHDVIRRVAEVQFATGLEILKLRDG